MSDDRIITAYSLRKVYVVDEAIDARPIQWDGKDYAGDGKDKDGRVLEATVYVTTCPKCGNMIQFYTEDILVDDDKEMVYCDNCGAGKEDILLAKEIDVANTLSKAYEQDDACDATGTIGTTGMDGATATGTIGTTGMDGATATGADAWQEFADNIDEKVFDKLAELEDPEGFADPIANGTMNLDNDQEE